MFTFYALFALSGILISNPVKCFLAERNAAWQRFWLSDWWLSGDSTSNKTLQI